MYKTSVLIITIFILLFTGCDDSLLSDQDIASHLTGEWLVDENSQFLKSSNLSNYWVTISLDPADSTQFLIDNFYQIGSGSQVSGIIQGTRLILNADQLVGSDFGSFRVKSGTGILSDNLKQIFWEYNIDDGSGIIDHVTATYNKN